ncbi:AAA family ATPase [Streptomyces sp. HNM0574]|uniref:AAA family ATPase n=1 Tax=Streptomyces sp. HNM0574 TaxID=2714954 RepID=UPI00146B3F9D|nr:AAA family ATPase [Streptomyces sp. HNM0574]NLU66356.1 ATP-binding protein [Streptomyces sp. HNM0574]
MQQGRPSEYGAQQPVPLPEPFPAYGQGPGWNGPGHHRPPAPGGPPPPPGPPPAAPAPHVPPAPAPPAPAPGGPAPAPAAPVPAPAPSGHPGHPAHPSGPPQGPGTSETTGHIQLPRGAPVEIPAPGTDPEQLDATRAAVAVLLIGPAGAGKTTVARHWAGRRAVPTAHISLDDVREWVRSGFADPQTGWNEHSEAQYRLARRTCGFAARNFLANNISCVLDDAVFPDRPVIGLGGWKRHVGPGLIPVVLLPGLEVVLERNAERSGNRRLSDEEVATIHGRMAGWYGSGLPIIDNTRQDVATTARMLDDVVARSLASPPSW